MARSPERIAAQPSRGGTRWLSQVSPIRGAYEVGPRVMDDQTHEQSVATETLCSYSVAEYPLNKDYQRFRAILGVTDDFSPDGAVTFTVYLDGQKAESRTLGLGPTTPLDVNVRGKRR